jgi:hypothetical protein
MRSLFLLYYYHDQKKKGNPSHININTFYFLGNFYYDQPDIRIHGTVAMLLLGFHITITQSLYNWLWKIKQDERDSNGKINTSVCWIQITKRAKIKRQTFVEIDQNVSF